MERAFKGVWIPKEIWLSKELSLQEKVFLVEIDSLDNDEGCFASNSYFAEFFGISNARVSQVINGLKKKGYLDVELERKGKQIIKRTLRINRPPYPAYLENYTGIKETKEGIKFSKEGIKETKEGYLENYKDNNINNNNINNNINNIYKQKHKYGSYKNVLLSDEEMDKLKVEFSDWEERIERVSEYCASTGRTYKNYLATIRNWARKEKKNDYERKDTGMGTTEARPTDEDYNAW